MEINVKKVLVISVSFTMVFGQYNAIDVGTAGARQLRMNGQLNSNFNPASLGYYATITSEIDTLELEEELKRNAKKSGKRKKRKRRGKRRRGVKIWIDLLMQ